MNWISTIVGNNTDFTRGPQSCRCQLDRILGVCSGYVNIARAYDFIDLWNAFSTICKGRHALSAAYLVYRINASKLGSTQYSRIDAVLLGGVTMTISLTPAILAGNAVSDNSRRICCSTARNVKANASQWNHL